MTEISDDKQKSEQELCESNWKETLEHFGIIRPILSFEKMKISRLIKLYDATSVAYALAGMRYEPKTESFDPSRYVGISRLDNPALFERSLNWAAQKMSKQKKGKQ